MFVRKVFEFNLLILLVNCRRSLRSMSISIRVSLENWDFVVMVIMIEDFVELGVIVGVG